MSLYTTGLHNHIVHKLLHATSITEHVCSYLCTTINISSDSGGVDNIVDIVTFEVQHLGKHCPSTWTLTFCLYHRCLGLTHSQSPPLFCPAVVLHSHSLERGPPIEYGSLILGVSYRNVSTTVNWTMNRSGVKPSWISMALIPTLFLPGGGPAGQCSWSIGAVRRDGLKICCSWSKKHTFSSNAYVSISTMGSAYFQKRKKKRHSLCCIDINM